MAMRTFVTSCVLAMAGLLTVVVDARVGWETHIRVGGIVAIRLGS